MRVRFWQTILAGGVLATVCALSACDRSPKTTASNIPPEDAAANAQAAATQPAPPSGVDTGVSPLPTLVARANEGDVSAMVALGRADEAIGGPGKQAEAHKWYEKAAKLGDESAKESLRMMDAAAAAATRPVEVASTTPTTVVSTKPAVPTSVPTVDPDHIKWDDIINAYDSSDCAIAANPSYRKKPTDAPIFMGLSMAPDKTMIASAIGPDGKNINEIRIAFRVRNKDAPNSKRAQQVVSIVSVVTVHNVTKVEMMDLINKYLTSGQKSAPLFRNGWSITVSGTQGEGISDSKEYLGEMVLVVMKK